MVDAAADSAVTRVAREPASPVRSRRLPGTQAAVCFAIASGLKVRRLARSAVTCALGALLLLVSAAEAETLDHARISGLIETTARDIGQPFPGVHIHVVDPAVHVRADAANGDASFDFAALLGRINGDIAVPLGFAKSMAIGRQAAFAFFHREMATGLHALPDGRTLCMVYPMPAPLRLAELASLLSGNAETPPAAAIDFEVADFYRFLLFHEVAHCAEDPWRLRARGLGAYDIYLAESRADAFAVLMHIARTGGDGLPRFMAQVRRDGMTFRGDAEHQTATVIENAIALATDLGRTGSFEGMSLNDMMLAARALAQNHALGREDFDAKRHPPATTQWPLP